MRQELDNAELRIKQALNRFEHVSEKQREMSEDEYYSLNREISELKILSPEMSSDASEDD